MTSDAELFAKLVRKTAQVLDPADPKKKVFQEIVNKNKKETDDMMMKENMK